MRHDSDLVSWIEKLTIFSYAVERHVPLASKVWSIHTPTACSWKVLINFFNHHDNVHGWGAGKSRSKNEREGRKKGKGGGGGGGGKREEIKNLKTGYWMLQKLYIYIEWCCWKSLKVSQNKHRREKLDHQQCFQKILSNVLLEVNKVVRLILTSHNF